MSLRPNFREELNVEENPNLEFYFGDEGEGIEGI